MGIEPNLGLGLWLAFGGSFEIWLLILQLPPIERLGLCHVPLEPGWACDYLKKYIMQEYCFATSEVGP